MKWSTFCLFIIGWIASAKAEPISTYEVKGVLRQIDQANRQAVISHEAVPGYMEAMTMSFDIADIAKLKDLNPGDAVTFQLYVAPKRAWIDHVQKIGASRLLPLSPAPTPSTHELSIGQVLPEFEFINEAGQRHQLSEFKGQVLTITFIYTRCPLPTYCPLLNRNFQTAQQLLDRLLPNNKARFLSISMDPKRDTPEVLAGYAKGYEADSSRWNFAITSEETLRTVGDSVGLEIKRSGEQIDHNLRTVVIDASGRIQHIFRGNTWMPQELAAAVRRAARI